MNLLPIKQQASIFADLQNFQGTPKIVGEIFDIYRNDDFIPTTVMQALSPLEPPVNRPSVVSSDQLWNVNFLTTRMDVIRFFRKPNESFLQPSEFEKQSLKLINLFIEKFHIKANRVSLIKEYFISDIDTDYIRKKLLNTPGIFDKNPISEWTWGICGTINRQIGELNEALNAITSAKLATAQINTNGEIQEKTGVMIAIEINTSQQNLSPRFTGASLGQFFDLTQEVVTASESIFLGS